jgi:cellulose synthase/poly-beta-1,6-N-acetylglucosamine synthase-like glycosyltransferase
MAASPPLSVLLPVRNGESTLPEALNSITHQTFPSFEIVIVDDGSTDNTVEFLMDKAREDPRIHVVCQGPKGIVAALETARQRAGGRYLARMDADDVAAPQRLEKQMKLVNEDHRVVVCGTGVSYFPRNIVRDGALRYEAWVNGLTTHEAMEADLFVECPIPHPTFLLKAEAVDLVGGYRKRGWPEDYDLLLRLWEAGGRLGKVPEVLLSWRESPDRLSRVDPAYSEEEFRRCRIHHLLRSHLRGDRGVVIWGAGPVGKAFSRALAWRGQEVVAFIDLDPRKIGQVVHGAPVFSPDRINDLRGCFCLAAVGQPGARGEIRVALQEAGWKEIRDFVAVA